MSYPAGGNPYRIYREQQVSNLSTGRLVLLAMETALRACKTGQRGLLTQVLEELMAGLDLSQGEVAAGLLRLYEFSFRLVREGRMDEAAVILRELRDTWEEAVKIEEGKTGEARGSARETLSLPGS